MQGEGKVAVTEITFSTQINNVTDNNIGYYKKDLVIASMKVEKDKISRPYLGEKAKLTKGEYTSIEQILDEIRRKTELEKLDYAIDPITKHLSLWLHYWDGITFSSLQILSLLEFKGVIDGTGYPIGYKQETLNITHSLPKILLLTIPLMYVLVLSLCLFTRT